MLFAEPERNSVSKHQIRPEYGDEQADAGRDCRIRLVKQILRRERGQGNINFSCLADNEQNWQPYPIDPYSCCMCVTYHTLHGPHPGVIFLEPSIWLEMRVHPAIISLHATTVLGLNATPSTATTALCHDNIMGTRTREVVDRLVSLQHIVKLVARRLAQEVETSVRQTGSTTAESPFNFAF